MKNKLRRIFFILIILLAAASIFPYLVPIGEVVYQATDFTTQNSLFLTIDGTTLHYNHYRTANPAGTVVFIHGFGGSLFSFRKNIDPFLNASLDVVMIDLPGFGLSERSLDIDYSNEGRAKLLLKVADHLSLPQPIHWVGHSMGGSILSWIPAISEKETGSLILVAAPSPTQDASVWARYIFMYPPLQQYLKILAPGYITKERVGSLLSTAYGRPLQESEVKGYYEPLLLEDTHLTFIGLTRDRTSELPDLASYTVPILLIWGSDDTWVPISEAEPWQQLLSDIRLETISGAGHNPMETHTETFNAILLEFIESTESFKVTP